MMTEMRAMGASASAPPRTEDIDLFSGLSLAGTTAPSANDTALIALTLPSAPTTLPVSSEPRISIDPMNDPLSPLNISSLPDTAVPVPSTAVTSAARKRGNLSTLMLPSEVALSRPNAPVAVAYNVPQKNLYPDLPQLVASSKNSRLTSSSIHQAESTAVASQEESKETDSLIQRTTFSYPTVVPSSALTNARLGNPTVAVHSSQPLATPALHSDTQSSTLVNDLLQENSRLSDEVTRLQLLLQQQQPQQSAQALSSSSSSFGTQSTVSGTEASERLQTQQPNGQVKYVCCGGCHQWLVASRTAVLVACSHCDAINNCNVASAPPGTLPLNVQPVSSALSQRTELPWYLECLRPFV